MVESASSRTRPPAIRRYLTGALDEMRSALSWLARELPQDQPEDQQAQLRIELGLAPRPVDELLVKLHESVMDTEPDFVLVGSGGSAPPTQVYSADPPGRCR